MFGVQAATSSAIPSIGKIRVFDRFEDLPASVDLLFRESAKRSFFLSRPWFENFAATSLPKDEELAIVTVEPESPEDTALAVFVAQLRRARHAPFDLRTISGLANFYTMEFLPIVSERDKSGYRTIVNAIRLSCSPDLVFIGPVDPLSNDYADLIAGLEGTGFSIRPRFRFGRWSEPVAGRTFDEYLRDRPSILRNTLRRRRQSLQKSNKARFEIVTDAAQLTVAFPAYDAIYRASWKDQEMFPAFMPGLLRAAADFGCLRLGLLHVDDVPAAAQVWLNSGGRATIYKLAYDERFKSLSVGSLLTEYMMRHSIEIDDVDEVDFGSGDDSYKEHWMSVRHERWDVRALNVRSVRGLLANGALHGKAAVRAIVDRIRDLRRGAVG